jgi:sigma-B regulation protein RsbU (phosphoserine phosphatase)
MPYLEIHQDSVISIVEVEKKKITIGRNENNDIVLRDAAISRRHARLRRRGEGYVVEDCKSRHGVRVNGSPVEGSLELRDEDEISICCSLLRYHEGTSGVPRPRVAAKAAAPSPKDSAVIMSTLDVTSIGDVPLSVDPSVKLRALMEILRALQTDFEEDRVLPGILDSLFRVFPQAQHTTILFVNQNDGQLETRASRNRNEDEKTVRISQTVIRHALEHKQAVLSADALSDELFMDSPSIVDFGIRSLMCVPLVARSEEVFGVIQVHAEEQGRSFVDDDLEVLASVASVISTALENLRLHQDLMSQERMRRELQLAHEVQQKFLPMTVPWVDGYSFHAKYEAAECVGGDYYAFLELPDDRIVIAVGDVSGKGMSAALLMARLSSDVRYAVLSRPDPGEALQLVNRSLAEAEIEGRFVTLLLMTLDGASHRLVVANAGHIPPILKKADGALLEIREGAGMPLNVSPDPDYAYGTTEITVEPGAIVLAYTDGVIEIMNEERECFGIDRLKETLTAAPQTPEATVNSILAAMQEFETVDAARDDLTMVCLGRSAG